MRKLLGALLVLGFTWLPASAQDPNDVPVAVRMDVVQLPHDSAPDQSRISGLPNKSRLLQSTEVLTLLGRDALFHLGRKNAITYYDPRASQFQVQYVDTGCKIDVKVKAAAQNTMDVDVRTEYSVIEGQRSLNDKTSYPQTQVFTPQTHLPGVRSGDSVVISHFHGAQARKFLANAGVSGSGDDVMVVLTVTRL